MEYLGERGGFLAVHIAGSKKVGATCKRGERNHHLCPPLYLKIQPMGTHPFATYFKGQGNFGLGLKKLQGKGPRSLKWDEEMAKATWASLGTFWGMWRERELVPLLEREREDSTRVTPPRWVPPSPLLTCKASGLSP